MQSVFDAVGEHARTGNYGGRPKLPFSPTAIYRLSLLGFTTKEIADFLDVSVSTIYRRLREPEFRDAYTKGKANVKISVRRSQFRLAMAGNVRMQIWLGKQFLGQKDVPINQPLDHDLPERAEGRVIHIPWTKEFEEQWNAIDAEFHELDGVE